MSRTDVHRPWNVQMSDPYNRHRLRRHAYWPAIGFEWLPLYQACGCAMCTNRLGYKVTRRRARHSTKQLLRRGDWEAIPTRTPLAWVVTNRRQPWSSTYPEQARAVKAARAPQADVSRA